MNLESFFKVLETVTTTGISIWLIKHFIGKTDKAIHSLEDKIDTLSKEISYFRKELDRTMLAFNSIVTEHGSDLARHGESLVGVKDILTDMKKKTDIIFDTQTESYGKVIWVHEEVKKHGLVLLKVKEILKSHHEKLKK